MAKEVNQQGNGVDLQIGEGTHDRRRGVVKSPDRGQRSINRSDGARSNPKSEEPPRLARQEGVTAQRTFTCEVKPGEGRYEPRRWSQVAAEGKVRDGGGGSRK